MLVPSTSTTKRSKYRHITQEEPLWIIVDAGNTDVKMMIHANFGNEIHFPHCVRSVRANEYQMLQSTYTHKPTDFVGTAIFEARGQGFVVGKHATQVGEGITLLGPAKYAKNHFDTLFEAGMIQLYPDNHPDIRLVVLHPPLLSEYNTKRLYSCLYGTHQVNVADGRCFEYTVTEINLEEEPTAAFQTFALTTKGTKYVHDNIPLEPGTQFLIVDIGGGLTVMVPALINDENKVELNLSGSKPINVGIANILPALSEELKAMPELQGIIGAHSGLLPLSILQEALKTNQVTLKNIPYKCRTAVDNSMQLLAYPMQQTYTNSMGSGIAFNGVVTSGGGGGITFDYVKENVLQHDFVYRAEEKDSDMRHGALRGASKALISQLAKRGMNASNKNDLE